MTSPARPGPAGVDNGSAPSGARGFWITFAAALAIRLAYVAQIQGTPVTDALLIDSETYDRFARLILAGRFRGEEVYSMNLLYPIFLAGIYRVAGAVPFAALVVQAVMGALNAAVIFALARRCFDAPAAWVAGLGAALYAPFVFYTGALLTPTLIESFVLVSLLLLATWRAEPRMHLLLLAGLCTGFAALGRGSALLLVALAPPFFRIEAGSWGRALKPWASFALGALLVTGLATVRNAFVEKRFVPISANYAAFYIGHNEHANGLYSMPDFVTTAAFAGEVTGVREMLSREAGRELSQAEASAELFRRGLRWALAHPRTELGLAARKFYFFWNRTESPTNLSFHFAREFSGLLRALPLHFGIVAPLGLAGMLAARRRWREHLLLHLALLVPLLTCMLFFVSAEYRLPAAAVLLLFASSAATRTIAWAAVRLRPARVKEPPNRAAGRRALHRARPAANGRMNSRDGGVALAMLPVLFIACNFRSPLLLAQSRNRIAFYDYGVLFAQQGRLDPAESMLRRSLAVDANFAPAVQALGNLENRRGNSAEAMQYFARARQLDPSLAVPSPQSAPADDQPWIEAEQLFRDGRYDQALVAFERARQRYAALGQKDAAISVSNNLGLTLTRLGRYAEAERTLRGIIAEAPGYVRAYTNLAVAYEAQGRTAEAEAEYRRALEIEPANRRARSALERIAAARRRR